MIPKFHMFHEWGKWVDGEVMQVRRITDALGIPVEVGTGAVISEFLSQSRHCLICSMLQTRRIYL